jgi:thymidylate synthase ThyX
MQRTLVDGQFEVTIVEDSAAPNGRRLTTFQLQYPRFIHAEFMTHRAFSRNASSSRAIPVAKMLDQVRSNPAHPIHWGANQAGMQAREELTGTALQYAQEGWTTAANCAADIAEAMSKTGAHKQIANRILEPFQLMKVIVTATEWSNFFDLRCHPDAQPEIQKLATMMRDAYYGPIAPWHATLDRSNPWSWHLPYVKGAERDTLPLKILVKASVARCARVSYLTHEGKEPDWEKDVDLYDKLVGSVPIHASPAEHQAYPLYDAWTQSKNFMGWRQWREHVEDGFGNADWL